MREAHNVISLRNVDTPLVGGSNHELQNADFNGLTPKTKIPTTPNALAKLVNIINIYNNVINYIFSGPKCQLNT